jgi:hypothetical protein
LCGWAEQLTFSTIPSEIDDLKFHLINFTVDWMLSCIRARGTVEAVAQAVTLLKSKLFEYSNRCSIIKIEDYMVQIILAKNAAALTEFESQYNVSNLSSTSLAYWHAANDLIFFPSILLFT